MALTTEAELMSALIGRQVQPFRKTGTAPQAANACMYTPWYAAGNPVAGAAPASGMAGATCDRTTTGAIQLNNASAGKRKYLAGLRGIAGTQGGTLAIFDRLWEQSGIVVTTTTAQTINSVALPARDGEGGTNGEDVIAAIEVRVATTNAAAITNMTISYTNSDGTAGRTGTISANTPTAGFPANAKVGVVIPFALQAGDRGVRSIQSITLGTSLVTGTVHLVMLRLITLLPFASPEFIMDPLDCGLISTLDNCCLQPIMVPISVSANDHHGAFTFVEG